MIIVHIPQETPTEDIGEGEEGGEEDRPDSVASKSDKKETKLTNQFNLCERASQTLNNPMRVRKRFAWLLLENHQNIHFLCRRWKPLSWHGSPVGSIDSDLNTETLKGLRMGCGQLRGFNYLRGFS